MLKAVETQWEIISRSNKDLSEDVIFEILTTLPIKSLCRFKCLCKSWYALISSSEFIDKHSVTYKSKNVSLFCRSKCNHNRRKQVSILSFRFSGVSVLLNVPLCPTKNVKIVGSCNGVVCLSLSDVIALWNPATKQFKIIGPSYSNMDPYSFGFCFDPITNSFKVICVSFPSGDNNNSQVQSSNLKVKILTVRTNSWKEKNLIVPFRISWATNYISSVTCVRRCMYWKVEEHFPGRRYQRYIMCFDMVEEMFKRIEFPSICHNRITVLAGFKDTIGLFIHRGVYYEVWAMNEYSYGATQSWSHQIIIAQPKGVLSPLGFFIKEDVAMPVVVTNRDRYLFDPRTGETTQFPWMQQNIELFQYSETLVSF